MLRQFTLQPNEDKKIQIEGKFLIVTQATGPLELSIGGTTPVTVDEKDRIHLRGESPNDRALRIKNVSGGVNDIELHTSDLLVDKRNSVDIKNSIVIADDQRIGIDPGANIVQAIIQNAIALDSNNNIVRIAENQSIGIHPEQNDVDATLTHAIEVADNQRIGIDPNLNDVKAEIQNPVSIDENNNIVRAEVLNPVAIDENNNFVMATLTHAIELAANQLVGIDPNANAVQATITNEVTLAPGQTVNLDTGGQLQTVERPKNIRPLSSMIFEQPGLNPGDTLILTLDGNNSRDELILTADPTNTQPVWVGNTIELRGTPIYPGERIQFKNRDEISLSAEIGQTLYLSEVVYAE